MVILLKPAIIFVNFATLKKFMNCVEINYFLYFSDVSRYIKECLWATKKTVKIYDLEQFENDQLVP